MILFSGGLDSVMLAILLKRQGYKLRPVYMSHRANVGNVTVKELKAASKLARSILGETLLIVKGPAKGKEPGWYSDYGEVVFSNRLPVLKQNKDRRNRIFLQVLKDLKLAGGVVAVGLVPSEVSERNRKRWADIKTSELKKYLRGLSSGGQLVTLQTLGHEDKAGALRAIGKRGAGPGQVWSSESCLMYFAKPCGNCASCKARAEAFLEAWGEDKTPYRTQSAAGRMKKRGRANRGRGRRATSVVHTDITNAPQTNRHITRLDKGTLSVSVLGSLKGSHAEHRLFAKDQHGRYTEEDWLRLVEDIRQHGVKEPVTVNVYWTRVSSDEDWRDQLPPTIASKVYPSKAWLGSWWYLERLPGESALRRVEPYILEGNHRIRAAAAAGLKEIPVHVRYFGHSDQVVDLARADHRRSLLKRFKRERAGRTNRKGQRYYYYRSFFDGEQPEVALAPKRSEEQLVATASVGDRLRLTFPKVRGAPRRKWMEDATVYRVTGRAKRRVARAGSIVEEEYGLEIEPAGFGFGPKRPKATLYTRVGYAEAAGFPVELDVMLDLYGKDGRGHTTGHPVVAELQESGDAAPATRASSPAKRAKVDGKTVENIPHDAAGVVARYFAQVYLAGRGPRRIPFKSMKELLGRGRESPPFSSASGLTAPERMEDVYSWDGGHMILAGSMRRQGGHKTVDKKGIPLPVGDLDFVVVGPAFPPEPDLDALEGGRWSWLADLVKVELVSGGDRMRTYRFTATLPRTGERAPMHSKMRRAAAKSGVPTPATEQVEMQVNLMRADPEELGATLLYATGPGGYNAMMRTKAKRMGLKLNRYGLYEEASGKKIAGKTETSIFKAMGKDYKDPWDRGHEKAKVSRPRAPTRAPSKPKPAPKAAKPPSERVIRTQAGRARLRFESAEAQGLNPFQATMGRIRAMKRPEKIAGTHAFLQALILERPGDRREIEQLIAALATHLEVLAVAPPSPAGGQGYFAPSPDEEPGPLVADLPGVLLAKKWSGKEDATCYWMSEKLDGVRAIWDGSRFWSRNWKPFNAPDWFRKLMPKGVVLDGELWAGRGKFNETISAVKKKVPNDPQWKQIKYLVFDMPLVDAPFEARMKKLAKATRKGGKHLQMVTQRLCVSNKDLAGFHRQISKLGGEGVMLRRVGSPYEAKRSSTLLKLKEFHDQEARVTGHDKGLGRHLGRLGAYRAELLSTGAAFKVGTGLSDAERDRPLPVGSIITVRYQELTPAGIPRFPTFVGARDYE